MKDSHPPKYALRFLQWICPDHLYEEIEGDLLQKFQRDVKAFGERRAKRKLMWNTIRFFRPGIVFRNKFSFELNQLDMLFNHLKFATRIFLKDKFFSALNVLGLALGIAVSIIMLLILQNDLTYDRHHVNYKRIYRLGSDIQGESGSRSAWSARELGDALMDELPEVQAVVRTFRLNRSLLKYESNGDEKAFYEEGIMRADSNYFQVFTHAFIVGNPKTFSTQPNTIVITESIAKKYFGDTNALDKVLTLENVPWKVTGVIKDLPDNTHLKFEILLSGIDIRTWGEGEIPSVAFWNPDVYLYLLLPERYDTNHFLEKFPAIYDKYFKETGDQMGQTYTPVLEPLADIHFHSDLGDDEPHGKLGYLYAFSGVGILIVMLACINYMNLSTAKSATRATEIAVKRIVGSGKRSLALSFLTESILLAFISLAVAILLVFLVLNATSFNSIIDKNLTPDFLHNPVLLYGTPVIVLGIGIVSGLYPAFYLPSTSTITSLKGTFKNRKSSHLLRRVLITVQFAISIFVVVCTLFMQDQIQFVRNKELGFDTENVLVLAIRDADVRSRITSIKNELLSNPQIISATTASPWSEIGKNVGGTYTLLAEGANGLEQHGFVVIFGGEDYLKTMGMTLVSGRDFQPGHQVDIDYSFIVNESAVKMMNWGKASLGKQVKFYDQKEGQVIGIIKDFNYNSLHIPVKPLLIVKMDQEQQGVFLYLKVNAANLTETIEYIKRKWTHYDPGHPFEYYFLNDRLNEQYKADEIQKTLLTCLSYICIFISLLGLIGLSAFSATQRTKEIGVRKVLGANFLDIILLLSKNVLLLMILAAIPVIPLSVWVMNGWLENFAYRIELDYFIFLMVTSVAMGFVFLTVLFQSLKTVRANPVDSLKYE